MLLYNLTSLVPRPSIIANVVEDLVKLQRRTHQVDVWRRGLSHRAYTSTAVNRKCHASKRSPDVILRSTTSSLVPEEIFTAPSRLLTVSTNMVGVMRLDGVSINSICFHSNTLEWKTCEKWGRPGSIHHMND